MSKQNWKSIPNYEGIYEISNLGKVRNTKGQRLTPQIARGRAYVQVQKHNVKQKLYLATLVGNLFLGECSKGVVWSPKDGNPLNCNVDNLAKIAYQKGSRNGNSKLSDEDRKKILKSKLPAKALAKQLQVTTATVCKIRGKGQVA